MKYIRTASKTTMKRIAKRPTIKIQGGTWVKVIRDSKKENFPELYPPINLVSFLIRPSYGHGVTLRGLEQGVICQTSIDNIEVVIDKKLRFLIEMNRGPFIDE